MVPLSSFYTAALAEQGSRNQVQVWWGITGKIWMDITVSPHVVQLPTFAKDTVATAPPYLIVPASLKGMMYHQAPIVVPKSLSLAIPSS